MLTRYGILLEILPSKAVLARHVGNDIARTPPHIIVNPPNVLTEQPHTQELHTNKDEEKGKQGKDTPYGPLGSV
jgi:hypothetical protein